MTSKRGGCDHVVARIRHLVNPSNELMAGKPDWQLQCVKWLLAAAKGPSTAAGFGETDGCARGRETKKGTRLRLRCSFLPLESVLYSCW